MDRFDVVLVAVPRDRERMASLSRTLGLDPEHVQDLADNLPSVVRPQATEAEAEELFHALRDLGAKLELRRSATELVAVSGGRASANVGRASATAAMHTSRSSQNMPAVRPGRASQSSQDMPVVRPGRTSQSSQSMPVVRPGRASQSSQNMPAVRPGRGSQNMAALRSEPIEEVEPEPAKRGPISIPAGVLENPLGGVFGDLDRSSFGGGYAPSTGAVQAFDETPEPSLEAPIVNPAEAEPVAKVGAVAGRPTAPRSAADRALAGAAPVVNVARAPVPAPAADSEGFAQRIVPNMIAPLRGTGAGWVFTICIFAVFCLAVSWGAAFMPFIGMAVAGGAYSILLALNARFFRAAFWGELSGAGEPDPRPELDPDFIKSDLLKPGAYLLAFQVLMQAATILYAYTRVRADVNPVTLMFDPLMWLLAFGPLMYWPIGLALVSLTGEPLSFFRVPRALSIVAAAPLAYIAVLGIGLVAFLLPFAAFMLVVTLSRTLALVMLPALVGLPIAYMHGVQGGCMGALFREKPELAEKATATDSSTEER